MKPKPIARPKIGVQIEARYTSDISKELSYVLPNTLVKISAPWKYIEPSKGVYDWSGLDNQVNLIKSKGLKVIISTRTSPDWSRPSDNMAYSRCCRLPDMEYWPNYTQFIQNISKRYSPYAIEIWNEPDVETDAMPADRSWDEFLGCVGTDKADGVLYAQLFNKVYGYMKLFSRTPIWAGALMMSGASEPFIRGMSAALYKADAITFHAYPRYPDAFNMIMNKVATLNYHFYRLRTPFWCTETSYLGDGSPEHEKKQAEYVTYLNNLPSKSVKGWIHYTIANNGWEHSDLVEKNRKETCL